MRLKLLSDINSGQYSSGDVADFSEAEGQALIDAEVAELFDGESSTVTSDEPTPMEVTETTIPLVEPTPMEVVQPTPKAKIPTEEQIVKDMALADSLSEPTRIN